MNPITTSGPLELPDLAERFTAVAKALFPDAEPVVVFEAPRSREFGDFATNVALRMAKAAKQSPQQVAEAIVARAMADPAVAATVADAKPTAGFINLRLVPAYWHRTLGAILAAGPDYGKAPPNGTRVSLEFGSANPTGPLVVVQGRTLSIGSTLANALRFAGYDVFTEWIINDAGSQLDTLGRSLHARYLQLWDEPYDPDVLPPGFPEDGYPGAYVVAIAHALRARDGDRWRELPESAWLEPLSQFGRDANVAEQQATAARFKVTFDLWQSERAFHDAGTIREGIAALVARGMTYEENGGTIVRTTDFGDDKDRAVVRADGRPTYFAGDVTYHAEKLKRGDRVIDILGPDHHGYIGRLKALAAVLGRPGAIEVLIAQQITLKRGDEIVAMSKRAGNIVTLTDIIDEVGVDAARFFFVMLAIDSPLTFDLALAKAQSSDNPVYYVQYGHARIASLARKAADLYGAAFVAEAAAAREFAPLVHPAELALVRRLAELPQVVRGVAEALAAHRLPKYARDVASDFHDFYDRCVVLGDDRALSQARLALALATKDVLAITLALCGVSAPEAMTRD
jgi:arginyl-tRNA synthetase